MRAASNAGSLVLFGFPTPSRSCAPAHLTPLAVPLTHDAHHDPPNPNPFPNRPVRPLATRREANVTRETTASFFTMGKPTKEGAGLARSRVEIFRQACFVAKSGRTPPPPPRGVARSLLAHQKRLSYLTSFEFVACLFQGHKPSKCRVLSSEFSCEEDALRTEHGMS